MRATFFWSALSTRVSVSRWRLRLDTFEVRMWRLNACPRLNLPVPVFLKRFAAPLCVLSLGITISIYFTTLFRLPRYSGQRTSLAVRKPKRLPGWLACSRRHLRAGTARLPRRLCLLRRCWRRALLRLRWFGRDLHLRRGQNQMQRIAFLARPELHHRLVGEVLNQAVQDATAQVLPRHLTSAEKDCGLHLVAFGKEAQNVVLLGFVVVVVNVDAELYFLDHDLVLVLLGLAFALFLLVKVFAVIHDAANRRLCRG